MRYHFFFSSSLCIIIINVYDVKTSGDGATPDWLASSLRCLSQSCTVHGHSCNLSSEWFCHSRVLPVRRPPSFFPVRSRLVSFPPNLTPRGPLGDVIEGFNFQFERTRTTGTNGKTFRVLHTRTNTVTHQTEASDQRRTFSGNTISAHTVEVDCRGAASHARTIRRYTISLLSSNFTNWDRTFHN